MHNINAFLKFKFLQSKRTLEDLSNEISLDKGYLSRVFNNIYSIKKERNLLKLCNALNVDYQSLYVMDKEFEDLLHQYFQSLYYILDHRKNYQKIKKLQTNYINNPYLNISP